MSALRPSHSGDSADRDGVPLRIVVSRDTEEKLKRAAAAEGKDVASLVAAAVEEKLASVNDGSADGAAAAIDAEEWVHRLRSWSVAHAPSADEADDSRASIYQGRGE